MLKEQHNYLLRAPFRLYLGASQSLYVVTERQSQIAAQIWVES
jgi:hypothetical protein